MNERKEGCISIPQEEPCVNPILTNMLERLADVEETTNDLSNHILFLIKRINDRNPKELNEQEAPNKPDSFSCALEEMDYITRKIYYDNSILRECVERLSLTIQ